MYKIMLGNDEIFNPTRMSDLPVQEARQSEQLNEPGALQFTLIHGHPKYGLLEGIASYITAYDDDDIIFYGRVITDGLPTFSGQITYDCEGALSFLNDSEVTPSKNPISKTPQQLFEWCIQQHNADIGNDSRRTFTAGNVTVSEKNKSEQFQITSYTKTKDVIDNQLINVYGGYLKVRYDNGVRYLDWLEHYSDVVNPQTILIGENVIDRAFSNSGEGFFTVIRPVGKNGLLLDAQTIDVFTQEMITKYGRIVKTVSFSDASTKAALQTKAEEYVARIKKTLLCTGSIKMVDMHYIDGTSPKVQLGHRFTNIEGLNGVEMTVSALERDFMHEYEDSCEFGNDKSLREDGVRAGGSISKSSSRAGGAAGMNFKHIMELEDTIEINSETLYQHGQTLIQHYNSIEQQGNQITSLSTTSETLVDLVTDQGERITTVEGTGVIQNDELLSSFAGTMRIVRDSGGNITGLQFVDGTMVMDTSEGHMVTVGAAIAAAKNGVETIQGSALWNQRDNITGVAGEFEIVTDAQGNKTVVIKSGGGMKIRRNNVEYGIYDSGNLTGGLVVDKLNDGTVHTTIRGDIIDLTSNGQKAAVYVQYTDPASNHTIHDGDIWIQRNEHRTWNQAANAHEKWNQPGVKWRSKYGDVQYIRKNNAWVMVKDYALDVENEVTLHKTKESLAIIGKAVDTEGRRYSSILEVTARQIRTELTDSSNNLSSSITQNANKIGLVVEGTGANAKIKAAQIVLAINDDNQSNIIISADHIDLDGYVKATDITANYIQTKIAQITSAISMKSAVVTNSIQAGGPVYASNFYIGTADSSKNVSLGLAGGKVELVPNTNDYKITGLTFNGTEIPFNGTFSRAVSGITGNWSYGSGKLGLTVAPQGQVFTLNIPAPTETCTNPVAYNFIITAKCGTKTKAYLLKVNSTGGIQSFTAQ